MIVVVVVFLPLWLVALLGILSICDDCQSETQWPPAPSPRQLSETAKHEAYLARERARLDKEV